MPPARLADAPLLRRLPLTPARAATGLVVAIMIAIPLFGEAIDSSGDQGRRWDPRVEMQVAERVRELGGPYYVTGSDQKGPLWIGAYRVAVELGGRYNQWLVYGILVVLLQLLIAAALLAVARQTPRGADEPAWSGRSTALVAGTGLGVLGILTFSNEEWAVSLYSRNIVALLMAGALLGLITVPGRTLRRRRLQAIGAGLLAGLAVQTNPASALTAVVFAGLVLWLGLRGPLKDERRVARVLPESLVLFSVAGALALVSVIGWYAIRGGLPDFWDQWWTYNQHYTAATGNSLRNIIDLGWNQFRTFFRGHLGLLGVVAATIVVTAIRARRGLPVWLEVTLLAWLACEILAVTASQRSFPHYFVLVFVPILAMALVLAVRLADHVDGFTACAVAIATATVILLGPGGTTLHHAVDSALDFGGPGAVASKNLPVNGSEQDQIRTAGRAVLRGNPYSIAWSEFPGYYDYTGTISATRYPESRWMVGQIYGDPTGPHAKYTLPDTYNNWAADVRETQPRLWIDFSNAEPPAGSPYRRFRDCAYRQRWTGPQASGAVQRVWARVKPVERCLPALPADSPWNGGAAD